MGGQGNRRHTGIGHADVGETVDEKVGVDNTTLIARQHGAGRRGVEFSAAILANPVEDVVVTLDIRAW